MRHHALSKNPVTMVKINVIHDDASFETLSLVNNIDDDDDDWQTQSSSSRKRENQRDKRSSGFAPGFLLPRANLVKLALAAVALSCGIGNQFGFHHDDHDSAETGRARRWRRPGQLRLDWEHVEPRSSVAREFTTLRNDCAPRQNRSLMWFEPCDGGLGCVLHSYAFAMCLAHREGIRFYTPDFLFFGPTAPEDSGSRRSVSAMNSFFTKLELQCPGDEERARQQQASPQKKDAQLIINRLWKHRKKTNVCESIMNRPQYEGVMSNIDMRAASIESMFTAGLSPAVVREARRQHALVFPDGAPPSERLITVHVRWGDKKSEMELVRMDEYIQAVYGIAATLGLEPHETHVYLATEDPAAVDAFRAAQHADWHVYVDQFHSDMLTFRDSATQGVADVIRNKEDDQPDHIGLWAMGSLLVSLESNHFVLTSASNWSRLINELRRTILQSTCPGGYIEPGHDAHGYPDCTSAVDLRKADFWLNLDADGNGV